VIVFDSSTLILLAKVDLLETFVNSYRGEVVIPIAVRAEAVPPGPRANAIVIRRTIASRRITVRKARSAAQVRRLMADFALGRGEAEALVLALETGSHHVATDDRNAMTACRALGIEAVSALAVLVRARQKGQLSQEKAEGCARDLAKYGRYAAKVLEEALRQLVAGG
jgi:predicted nucleic acid-binding protein